MVVGDALGVLHQGGAEEQRARGGPLGKLRLVQQLLQHLHCPTSRPRARMQRAEPHTMRTWMIQKTLYPRAAAQRSQVVTMGERSMDVVNPDGVQALWHWDT